MTAYFLACIQQAQQYPTHQAQLDVLRRLAAFSQTASRS